MGRSYWIAWQKNRFVRMARNIRELALQAEVTAAFISSMPG
jgi:hypothetical protein